MSNLSEYIEISSFNENTVLVQKDNVIYVKKRVPKELTYIYKILLYNPHKNVSDIIEIFEYEDSSVIIEEYVNGKTLLTMLSEKETLNEKDSKNIIGQICDGLIFLHKHNIIHRDINPNNIMITKNGDIEIIDFDIARRAKKNSKTDTTVLGTVGYAAPEQFGFAQSDMRTDIYAVGVLANVMLTGEMPNKKLYGGKIGAVIRKATAIDANMRYKSISDFKHAFTNQVDENTNKFIKALRCVPGFRTWILWKMVVATAMYTVYIPLMLVFISWSITDLKALFTTIFSEILIFVIPFILLTNLCDIQSRFSHKRNTARAAVSIISITSFIIGACILANSLKNIL